MRRLTLVLVVLGLLSLPLMAQDNVKAEVFGGYMYEHLGGDFGDINANGWDASLTGNINKNFGITGDFSGAYKNSAHIYTYGGGPVVAYDFGGKINPFVHAIFGGYTAGGGGGSGINGFMMKFGGGLDVGVSKVLAIRLAQFDWDYYKVHGVSEDSNVNISTGIVLRF